MNEYIFLIDILSLKGYGNKKVYDLIKKYNFDYSSLYGSLKYELGEYMYTEFINNIERSEYIYKSNISHYIKVISLFDKKRFPKCLYETEKPCLMLYYCGDISLLSSPCVTVIGTRKPDEEFIDKGKLAVKKLTDEGFTIVSGLALGSDALAHKECLNNNGKTIAILPSSLDNIMPRENKELARSIAENGGLIITEYPYKSRFNKYAYAERDRLQAYLSDNILVIESTDDGGTMIAVKHALSLNKNVYALTGNNLTLVKNYIDASSDDFTSNFKAKEEKEKSTDTQLSLFN